MPDGIFSYLLIAAAYFLGSVSSAIIICKLMGLTDPRTAGSKNPGATNVLRIGGKKAAAFTLLGDVLKGVIPVLIGKWLGLDYPWLGMIGLAAFLGHLYPIYYGLSGGKGVATAMGIYIALHPLAGLIVVAIWLIMAKGFRVSSLAALIAALLAPPVFYLFIHSMGLTVVLVLMTILIYWRHRSNIQNLLNGTESLIGSK